MLNIIAIFVSIILGAIAGRIACNIMNRNAFVINPALCTIAGIVGGAIGSWVFMSLGFGASVKSLVFQVASGIGLAILLLILVWFFRDREDEDEKFEE